MQESNEWRESGSDLSLAVRSAIMDLHSKDTRECGSVVIDALVNGP